MNENNPTSTADISVRHATAEDTAELCDLLNAIIRIGGTTAYQQPLTQKDFENCFITGPENIACFVAVATGGTLLGFQAIEHSEKLPRDCGDIATFVLVNSTARGVGTALFESTKLYAREKALSSINATIRADNESGLKYYSKIGFEDHSVTRSVPLNDGTPVDRISKRYNLLTP